MEVARVLAKGHSALNDGEGVTQGSSAALPPTAWHFEIFAQVNYTGQKFFRTPQKCSLEQTKVSEPQARQAESTRSSMFVLSETLLSTYILSSNYLFLYGVVPWQEIVLSSELPRKRRAGVHESVPSP